MIFPTSQGGICIHSLEGILGDAFNLQNPRGFHRPKHRGEVGEDPTATCEPFFVPRQPIFEDEVDFF